MKTYNKGETMAKTDLAKIAQKLEEKYPKHKEFIQDKLQDFGWQIMYFKDFKGKEYTIDPLGNVFSLDGGSQFVGDVHASLLPCLMNEEQFEYNLEIELAKLEEPNIENQERFREDIMCRKLLNEPCGIYGS